MKWLLTFNILVAGTGLLSAADPMPMPMPMSSPMGGVLPHPTPMSTTPTVPSPTLSGTSNWNTDGYSNSCSSCDRGCGSRGGGSAFSRICEWLSFRACPPVHNPCVPQPYRAPLRSYFTHSACGVGCANASDCGSGCSRGPRCGGSQDSVYIPMPSRMCGNARCGGTPVWGRNSCGSSSCSGGLLSRLMGCFGLSGGSCGGKGKCSSCGGLGGCSSCNYSQVPMSDIGQYHSFQVTQSVGRINGLSSTGAAPANSHYANPYKATSAELQYSNTPGASLAPAQTMPPPVQQGTNPFPGPQGTLPYSRPFTNP